MIHMKCQGLFSLEKKKKKKLLSAGIMVSALSVDITVNNLSVMML